MLECWHAISCYDERDELDLLVISIVIIACHVMAHVPYILLLVGTIVISIPLLALWCLLGMLLVEVRNCGRFLQ